MSVILSVLAVAALIAALIYISRDWPDPTATPEVPSISPWAERVARDEFRVLRQAEMEVLLVEALRRVRSGETFGDDERDPILFAHPDPGHEVDCDPLGLHRKAREPDPEVEAPDHDWIERG